MNDTNDRRLSKGQRKVLKYGAVYAVMSVSSYSVIHLIKGDLELMDTLLYGAAIVAVTFLIALFVIMVIQISKQ